MGISGVSLNKHDLIRAIKENNGVIAHAAKQLGCSRNAIFNWEKIDSDVANAVIEAREEANKMLEDSDHRIKQKAYVGIEALIDKCDVTAIIFALKCKAKWNQDSGSTERKPAVLNAPSMEISND